MANAYNGLSLTAIADATLANLKRRVGPLRQYTSDFSDAFMAPGMTSITTRYWATKAARTYTASDTAYTADDSASTAVTVTPSILYHRATINELADSGTPVNIEAALAATITEAIAKGAFDVVNALILNATFAQKKTVPVANFGMDDVLAARADLDAGGSPDSMHTVVSAAAYLSLLQSPTIYPQIQANAQGDGNVLQFPGVGNVSELSAVGANAENLYGWTASPDALVLVARQPQLPRGFSGDVATAADPESGLSVQVRSWFDPATGLYNVWGGTLFGAAAGRAASLVRYVSA